MRKIILAALVTIVTFMVSSMTCFALTPKDISNTSNDISSNSYTTNLINYPETLELIEDQMIKRYQQEGEELVIISRIEQNPTRYYFDMSTSSKVSEHELFYDFSDEDNKIYDFYKIVNKESLEKVRNLPSFAQARILITDDQSIIENYPEIFDNITIIESKEIENDTILVHVSFNKHYIANGDTLSKIALNYGTTVEKLVALNKIENPDLIYAGDYLFLQ